ncbi:glycosyltransferase family protein [Robiginitalea sediminis]|uniref:glycosyltransferase family protein n=1 Tax=Robiginitalea sediminis TaxID=1982593 RepID=UPI000B4C110D|nr:glycosyltransferase family protein [Robiginitalea sediminis]
MKVLYAIQGTGNGHLSRARAIIPELLKAGVQLDLLVSGVQSDIPLPYEVKFRFGGMSFIFGRQGGVDIWETYLQINALRIQKEVRMLPVRDYDLVLNDFEPISAWACKLRGIPCIGISHQAAVLSPSAPRPNQADPLGLLVLKRYAPVSAQYGFHFQAYDPGIFTPVIRKGVREASLADKGHYTVYLPAYEDQRILNVLLRVPDVDWQVFSKHGKRHYEFGNVRVQPVSNEAFLASITRARGVLCAAGFETPSEALFMGKKLCVIPMKGQYEQQCNAAALGQMGVPILESLHEKTLPALWDWVDSDKKVSVNYPDVASDIVCQVLNTHAPVLV